LIISLIVAAADNGIIGRDNALPWHLPEDLKRFKRITMGKPIVMGRKTFDSIGKPLPGRQNIVVTRDSNYHREGVTVAHSVEGAVTAAGAAQEIMIIGGADLFRLFLPSASRVHLTRVHGDVDGDVRWEPLDESWCRVAAESHPADERHSHAMTFELWEKRQTSAKNPAAPGSAS
jgi:dihydrofolate reductase